MKKYFFALSLLALLATVACETASKTATTQTAAAPQVATVAVPVAAVADSATLVPSKKGYSKKAMMQHAEMAPLEKAQMLRKADEAPAKN